MRTASLVLRTPTHREAKIAMAGASDDEAQRWLGWEQKDVCPEPHRATLLSASVNEGDRPERSVDAAFWALIAIDPGRLAIAGLVGFVHSPDGLYNHVGGHLAPQYRGRGLGRELFAAALVLGHQHLGIEVIRAGAESSNIASRKSLEAAGFRPVHGAPAHSLPNGRVIAACWYEHAARASKCRRSPRP
ncbi:GNAT family N-acetyltransferase [Actinospica sp. MGRD01-02]|uniref:GNAT family N-acetyltransferase n=1 Tax=Actinospica acidithermotolerans TaxID=2828514 RepID=A0A941EDQ0_9ACTN|nr:GNAT family N-acetyltransferase [Actinospica acidithermotolerans]